MIYTNLIYHIKYHVLLNYYKCNHQRNVYFFMLQRFVVVLYIHLEASPVPCREQRFVDGLMRQTFDGLWCVL